ncbi:LPS export ABC transporter periplasmic protein LptC [Bordetella genomosp. 9]|uniref:LPS export ABC transporter periplasmic protein LptC n=1 Tax=Bordetella genomosp. 9 TaxID=1416803 RepID=A0A1W6YVG5_9BORD|nr:LPS export ABC transporter periplasmic protein LptC [Bordetella genomosp. 9]ARP84978.1 LPS export ABC transporter periplasmic protein LptC [Bordetella genomosp. 9]
MKERFPSLIALFLLVLLVVGTWWAADYTQRAVPTDPPRRLTHEMDSWSRDFIMVRTDADGKPINRLEGVYGEHYPDDDSYVVTDPRAVGLRPNTPITVATSDTATMYEGGKRIVMNKNAHMHRQADQDTPPLDVRSEQLVLLPDEDLITTDLPALVTRGQSRMNGKGMKYNNKTRQLEVYASTNVEIAPADTRRAQQKDNASPASGAAQGNTRSPAGPEAAPAPAPAHEPAEKQP